MCKVIMIGCDLHSKSMLLKIGPDLGWAEIDRILDQALSQGVSGIIATNTTVVREGLVDSRRSEHQSPESGRGASGSANPANRALRPAHARSPSFPKALSLRRGQ